MGEKTQFGPVCVMSSLQTLKYHSLATTTKLLHSEAQNLRLGAFRFTEITSFFNYYLQLQLLQFFAGLASAIGVPN